MNYQQDCAAMIRHTPGPWGDRSFNQVGQIEIHTHTHVMCKVLCREIDDYGSVDSASVHEAAANARLIAAAPELLQALEEIVAEWDAGNIGRLTTIPGTPGWEESVGMKWARAAIAKATAE